MAVLFVILYASLVTALLFELGNAYARGIKKGALKGTQVKKKLGLIVLSILSLTSFISFYFIRDYFLSDFIYFVPSSIGVASTIYSYLVIKRAYQLQEQKMEMKKSLEGEDEQKESKI